MKKKKIFKKFIIAFLVIGCIGAIISGMTQSDVMKEDLTPKTKEDTEVQEDEEVSYKVAIEEYIKTYLGVYDLDFSFMNWRQWDDGAGFIMAENTYKYNGIQHKYVARIGKDNVVYKLTIDGVVMFSADADTLLDYMDKYPVE